MNSCAGFFCGRRWGRQKVVLLERGTVVAAQSIWGGRGCVAGGSGRDGPVVGVVVVVVVIGCLGLMFLVEVKRSVEQERSSASWRTWGSLMIVGLPVNCERARVDDDFWWGGEEGGEGERTAV
jgi:hypothetical protein